MPNAVLRVVWASDSSELLAIDEAGHARVWGLLGDARVTYQIGHVNSAGFWQAVAQADADSATESVRQQQETRDSINQYES